MQADTNRDALGGLERESFRELFSQSPALIAVTRGPHHIIEFANRPFLDTFGRRDLTDKPFREAFPELEGQGYLELLDQAYAGGEAVVGNERRALIDRGGDGAPDEIFLSFACQPLRNPAGAVEGLVIEATEVTGEVRSRKRAEDLETRLRGVIEAAPDAVIVADERGVIGEWNAQAERMFGWRREEAMGRSLAETILPPRYRDRYAPGSERFFESGERPNLSRSREIEAQRRDGQEFPAELTVSRVRTDQGYEFSHYVRDLTARRRAEQRLAVQHAATRALAQSRTLAQASRTILQTICESLGWEVGALWVVSEDHQRLHCHEFWHAPAVDVAEFEAMSRRVSFPPGVGFPGGVWTTGEAAWVPDVAVAPDLPRATVAAKNGLHAAFCFPVWTGGLFVGAMEFFSRQIRQPDEELLRMFAAVGSQIGPYMQRLQAEEQLRFQKTLLESQSEASIDGILVVSPEGKMLSFNQRFVEMWRIPESVVASRSDEAALQSVGDRVVDYEGFLARVHYLYEHPNEESRDELALRDGRTFERHSAPVRSADGTLYGRVWFFRDISERKRAEVESRFLAEAGTALSSSLDYEATLERVARMAVPYLADFCFVDVIDDRGRLRRVAIAHWDEAKERDTRDRLQRYPLDPRLPHPAFEVVRSGNPILHSEVDDALLRAIARTPQHLGELRQLGYSSWMCVPLSARGQTLGAMTLVAAESGHHYDSHDLALAAALGRRAAIAVDNSRLYRLMEEAVRTRDEFLSSVSHDLRGPLSVIKGHAQLAGRRLARLAPEAAAQLTDTLGKIDSAATKMSKLIAELVDVARLRIGQPLALQREPTDLVALARQVAAEHDEHAEMHRVIVDTDLETLVGQWDPLRLERVLANLLSNAIKYSPQGGDVRVSVHQAAPDWASLTVRDQGIGIPAGDLARIFERFERANNVDRSIPGTGVGLTAARQIVEQHGGTISVESTLGRGSTFVVHLPLGPST